MHQRLERIRSLQSMWRVVVPVFIILWICGAFLAFIFETMLPPGRGTSLIPPIIFKNMGPCLGPNQLRVEKFTVGESQWLCADVETDEPQDLYLRIYENETRKEVYVDKVTFISDSVAYLINPPLLPGRYLVTIRRIRSVVIAIEFEVVEK